MREVRRRARPVRTAVAVVVSGLALYLVLPALIAVVGAWPRLATLAPWWLVGSLAAQAASFVCAFALLRLVTHVREWFVIVAASLGGNAVTNLVPGGDALGAGVQYRMMASAGIRPENAVGGIAAVSILHLASLLALPVFALPAMVGGLAPRGLVQAAALGLAGFVLVMAFGAVVFTSDRVVALLARAAQWCANHLPRRARRTTDLPERLIRQRDEVRRELGRNWWRALALIGGHVGLDYVSLLCALRAAGARPNPALVLLAFAATAIVVLVPLTPGGLGIVEASLTGLLVLAGIPSSRAVLATLAYRIGAYWLPVVGGGVAYVAFRRRYPSSDAATPVT
jgi:hypothetical protein